MDGQTDNIIMPIADHIIPHAAVWLVNNCWCSLQLVPWLNKSHWSREAVTSSSRRKLPRTYKWEQPAGLLTLGQVSNKRNLWTILLTFCNYLTSALLLACCCIYIVAKRIYEHLYSPNQATRQTENRLYTQKKQRNTTIKTQKCILT